MIEDKKLLEYFMQGFTDELDNRNQAVLPYDVLIIKAYNLGRKEAIKHNDIRSLDYISNEEVINLIRYK